MVNATSTLDVQHEINAVATCTAMLKQAWKPLASIFWRINPKYQRRARKIRQESNQNFNDAFTAFKSHTSLCGLALLTIGRQGPAGVL